MGEAMKAAWCGDDFEGTPEERCAAMVKEALVLDETPENTFAHDHDLDLVRMYEQRPMTTLYSYGGRYFSGDNRVLTTISEGNISPQNYLRAVVSTAHAMLARSKVRGRVLTNGGNGKQKNRAKDATSWLDGWTQEAKLHEVAGQALLDGQVCRFGIVQLYEEGSKCKLQRVLPFEIVYDHTAAVYGSPTVIYRKRVYSKGQLIRKFAKAKGKEDLKDVIKNATTVTNAEGDPTDMVLVWEAWALPTAPGADDGWHAIGIDAAGGALLIEKWKKPWFPLVFFVWDPAIVGFGGVSLASQLEPMQVELNWKLYVERKAEEHMAVPRIGVKRGSKISKGQISNEVASIIEYSDEAPKPLIWDYMPEQFFREKEKLIQRMYSIPGISQTASEGVKPTGTESGAAQREAMETQNLRLQIYAQRAWEKPIVEIFEKAFEMAADITAGGGSYKVTATNNSDVSEVEFRAAVADLKTHKITIYPTGFLPLTPAARLDFIRSMLDAKLWDVDRARAALSDLDVESEQSLENSIQRLFNKRCEECLYEGNPQRPTELEVGFYDIGIKTGAVYMAMALAEPGETDEERIDLLQRYLDELQGLKAAATPKAPAPAPGVPPAAAPPPVAAAA